MATDFAERTSADAQLALADTPQRKHRWKVAGTNWTPISRPGHSLVYSLIAVAAEREGPGYGLEGLDGDRDLDHGVGYENKTNERGERLIWLEPNVVNRLRVGYGCSIDWTRNNPTCPFAGLNGSGRGSANTSA